MYELDHLLLFCRRDAPEAAILEGAGLRVGRRRVHQGQGTANACFFFGSTMLELIWVAEEDEARSPLTQPLGLWERFRWRESDTCPIGVCVRPTADQVGAAPFRTWDYAPPYLPEGSSLGMACNSGVIHEPLLFATDRRSDSPDVEHPLVRKTVTAARVTVRSLAPMSLLREVRVAGLSFDSGDAHNLEIELDGGGEGQTLDCRSNLPLVLRW